ncbi:hypothetical protein TYRP_023029 [Tyrophagus putrescentiae]|nr:hypothetical protein TYRP_023029 [Tyrophagus putrescentiae]
MKNKNPARHAGKTISKWLAGVFACYGTPKMLTTESGIHFDSRKCCPRQGRQLWSVLGTTKSISTTFQLVLKTGQGQCAPLAEERILSAPFDIYRGHLKRPSCGAVFGSAEAACKQFKLCERVNSA